MNKPKSIWSKADNFLSLIRKLLLNAVTAIVLIIITFSILGSIGSIFTDDDSIDSNGKVLWFKPTGVVVDSVVSTAPSLDSLLLGDTSTEQHELKDLLTVLNSAAEDESLAAIYVNVSELGMYYASAFEIANAVKNIRDNGKRVIAYAENFGNQAYLISSQADTVIVNEYGSVSAFGFARKREFYKDLYENINLNYNVFVAGDFKSGPEPYTRNSMSEEDKLAWNEFANPLWLKMTQMMESGRNLNNGTIQDYGDKLWEMSIENPEIAQIALELDLVDMVVSREELRHWMYKEFPNENKDKNELPDSISIYEYLSLVDEVQNNSENKIAIVNVEGTIVTGEASYNVAGSDTIVKNIRNAIKDNSVKALVLRVNSPGGDVWASELITNALNEFKSSGRPIVTSMGDIAASGGVWVTTLSDEIWAKEETITGSIGVYGIIPTLDGIYEWAGIQVDGVTSTKAGEWDERLPMPEYVSKAIQAGIDHTYDKFVSKVAENRMVPDKEILSIAGGRIWSGEKAVQLGLVDKIGDLNDAIESAASFADLDDYMVVSYSKEMDPFDLFINELLNSFGSKISVGSEIKMLSKIIDSNYRFIDLDKKINTAIYCFECEYFSSE
ncbi:MAG: signal peptide peptidase SppA [Rickettsiales bacterium]|nr:signal peptide peptidase SppA [Rickettsiales bacterium]|tara:strand:+ start:971 stop:2809 length:1839 start_codon:yes stop_codon:yes gene_type:complete